MNINTVMNGIAIQHNINWKESGVYSPTAADWVLSDSRMDNTSVALVCVCTKDDERFNGEFLTLPECNNVRKIKEYLYSASGKSLSHNKLKAGKSIVKHKGWFKTKSQGAQAYGVIMVDDKATKNYITTGKKNCSVISSRKLKVDGMLLVLMRSSFVEVQEIR